MFKSKKIITIIITLALLTAIATPVLAAGGTQTAPGAGDVVYVEIGDRFKVVLPASTALDFVLDPLGLSAIEPDKSMSVKELVEGDAAGSLLFHAYTPVVLNESNYEIQLGVELSRINGGTTGAAVAMVNSAAAAFEGTYATFGSEPNNVFIAMVASSDSVNKPTAAAADFRGFMQIPLTTAGINPLFVLDEAEYHVFNTGTVGNPVYQYNLLPETGNGTQLNFVGACNPFADWSAYVDSPSAAVAAVYTYAGLGTAIAALSNDDEISFGTGLDYTKADDDDADENEFDTAANLIAQLNADQSIWTFALANTDADITATARVAGSVGDGANNSGPNAAPSQAVITPDSGGSPSSITATVTTAGAERGAGASVPATRTLGIQAVYNVEAYEGPGGSATDTKVIGAYGVVIRSNAATSAGWVDSSELVTQRAALETGITELTSAIATFADISDPNQGQIDTAKTALATANAALTAAKAVENPDAFFSARILVLEGLIKNMEELIDPALAEAKADLAKAIADLQDAIDTFEAIADPNAAQIEAAENALEEAEAALLAANAFTTTDADFLAMKTELDNLIKEMKVLFAPTEGFIVSGNIVTTHTLTVPANSTWLAIPFEYGDRTVTAAVNASDANCMPFLSFDIPGKILGVNVTGWGAGSDTITITMSGGVTLTLIVTRT